MADHFKTDEDTIKKSTQEIGLAVLKKLTGTRPEMINETNVVVLFYRGPLVLFYRGQSWKRVAPIIFNKIGKDAIVAIFKELGQEEKSNFQRDLILGNQLAGWSSIWQRGENGNGLFRLLWFPN